MTAPLPDPAHCQPWIPDVLTMRPAPGPAAWDITPRSALIAAGFVGPTEFELLLQRIRQLEQEVRDLGRVA